MSINSANLWIATYNLRYNSEPGQITVESISALGKPLAQNKFLGLSGEHPWSTKRLRVAEYLLNEKVVITGFQEALVRQVNDQTGLLRDGRDWVSTICVSVALLADLCSMSSHSGKG
ncbi:hypothetical protein IW261DRAFT_1524846 [Armillaria novae-zelandiae]|uniref:Endonuclease/exonuclease/phosphatase domain-containing protein n=1 Tax=Armillaria novae-zelandiae TaxID=153914 RepID=A0AA39NEA4_9AGAR|nr:hypothetical protein IW261DRAFT_1524846 [Armillaria novae-zelandiae]